MAHKLIEIRVVEDVNWGWFVEVREPLNRVWHSESFAFTRIGAMLAAWRMRRKLSRELEIISF